MAGFGVFAPVSGEREIQDAGQEAVGAQMRLAALLPRMHLDPANQRAEDLHRFVARHRIGGQRLLQFGDSVLVGLGKVRVEVVTFEL